MKLLETHYRKNGYNFRLVKRIGDVAIYSQHDGNEPVMAYEVFIVQKHDGYDIGGHSVPAGEFIPKNELWGTLGFTVWTLEAAEAKATVLQARIDSKLPSKA